MSETIITSPAKAIRAFCIDCVGTANEVKQCNCTKCALHPFRMGKSPYRKKRPMTEEQKAVQCERLLEARMRKQINRKKSKNSDSTTHREA